MHRGSVALLIFVVSLVVPAMASAHAVPLATVPGSDGEAQVSLSVGVESGLIVANGATAVVDPSDDHTVFVSLEPDVRRADIRLLSRDGHVTSLRLEPSAQPSGSPKVSVGESVDSPLMIVARFLLLTSLCVGVGALTVGFLLLDRAREEPIVGLDRLPEAHTRPQTQVRERIVLGSLATAALSACALMGAILVHLGSSDLGALLLHTRIGWALGIVAVASVIMLVWLSRRSWSRTDITVAGVLGIGALGAVSLSGHATSGRDQVVSGALDTLHLAATSAWMGGLVALLLIHWDLGREEPRRRIAELAAVVVRFSTLGVVTVAVLVVTGVYRAIGELGSFGDLADDSYGRVLVVKVAIFAVLLLVAAVNRFGVHPRLERAARGLDATDRGACRLLRRSVSLELLLAAAIMVSVAVLIGVPPPR